MSKTFADAIRQEKERVASFEAHRHYSGPQMYNGAELVSHYNKFGESVLGHGIMLKTKTHFHWMFNSFTTGKRLMDYWPNTGTYHLLGHRREHWGRVTSVEHALEVLLEYHGPQNYRPK